MLRVFGSVGSGSDHSRVRLFERAVVSFSLTAPLPDLARRQAGGTSTARHMGRELTAPQDEPLIPFLYVKGEHLWKHHNFSLTAVRPK